MVDDTKRISRRGFAKTAVALAGAAAIPAGLANARPLEPTSGGTSSRRDAALAVRMGAAKDAAALGFPTHPTNGDEAKYDPVWVSYSKGLPHTPLGEADAAATRSYLNAIATRDVHAIERVPLGGYARLANPEAAFAFDLVGPDSHQVPLVPPPSFNSAATAAEFVELAWQALCRDVPFDEYEASPLIRSGCDELTHLEGYGPRINGAVTPASIFRGLTRGSQIGPYVSQFLWRDLPWTPIRVPQLIRIAVPQKEYMTDEASWLAIQNGSIPEVNAYETAPRYIRTGRDLAEYVHRDFTYQAFLGACLMLFRMSAPVDGGMPFQHSVTQSGFVTFGPSDILHYVALVANVALKASWYHKWVVHRRLRPEEFGARVHFHAKSQARYPLHSDVLNSGAIDRIAHLYGTRLLPQSYPEGAPLHPAYPAGHAVVAGACATALKACFAENYVIPDPVIPTRDGLHLERYVGPPLTVGGELDKLAENMPFARNFAGIHWRSDAIQGIRLGEAVAIEILKEMKRTATASFAGYTLTTFDGKQLTIR
jgi:hypothetical protein